MKKYIVLLIGLILTALAGCSAGLGSLQTSKWNVDSINGTKVILPSGQRITMDVNTDKASVSGRAPCNSYSATYVELGESIKFSPIVSTKMACDELSLENQYFEALGKVTSYTISGNHLSFYSGTALVIYLVKP
jgi:heat shock protein HslJ